MKNLVLSLLAVSLFTAACQHRPPDIFAPPVPAAPLVQALDAQRKKLASIKAVARVETERKGRRRSYESIAVAADGRGRLRVEGFGPLGESLFTLVWDGQAVLLRPPGENGFVSVGQAGLERALGVALSPADLCAALGGNVLIPLSDGAVQAGCRSDGNCVIQYPDGGAYRRIYASRPAGENADGLLADGADLYEGGRLIYRGRFEERKLISGYSFPLKVSLENPDRALRLTVHYEDVEVNVPIEDALFQEDVR